MTVGEILIRNMRREFKRASAQYTKGYCEYARFWIGGCASLASLADSLAAQDHISDSELKQMVLLGDRARTLFEEMDLGAETNPPVKNAYPDPHALALDEYMAEHGV